MQKLEGAALNRRLFMDRSCLSKVRHVTREAAQAKANRLRCAQDEQNIEPYSCRFCGGWHVGHSN
jgi:hypothetical protein